MAKIDWKNMSEEQIYGVLDNEKQHQKKQKYDAQAAKAAKPVAKREKADSFISINRRANSSNAKKAKLNAQ